MAAIFMVPFEFILLYIVKFSKVFGSLNSKVISKGRVPLSCWSEVNIHFKSIRELSSLLVVPSINLSNPIPACNWLESPLTVMFSFETLLLVGLPDGNSLSKSTILAIADLEFNLLSTNKALLISISQVIFCLAFNVILAIVSVPFTFTLFPILVKFT